MVTHSKASEEITVIRVTHLQLDYIKTIYLGTEQYLRGIM